MINFSHIVKDVDALKMFLESEEIRFNARKARSILIQLFSSLIDQTWVESIAKVIEDELPAAILVGSSTVGEIVEGHLQTGTTVLSLSFFDTSTISPIALSCSTGDEFNTGQFLNKEINGTSSDIAGVLLLATPLSIDVATLLSGMSQKENNYPVFGGGAGAYALTKNSLIFCGKKYFDKGVIAVVLAGKDLQISSHTFLGWQPLSKEMTITNTEGMLVKTIDNAPAFEVYHHYLGIKKDEGFFLNVLEFPFLLKRNGQTLARVPFFVDEDGAIKFIADINVGEKFHIGYGDPETIVQDAEQIQKNMCDFQPDAIFLYACICRRFLMQNDVNLETRPFENISPTVGFYTYGEFYGCGNELELLNSTMVVVGMREGEKPQNWNYRDKLQCYNAIKSKDMDPYANKHNRIVSGLLHFINVMSAELEQVNKKLTKISEIDKVTQIYNRLKLDDIFQYEIEHCERDKMKFSIILMDIDNFKQVNDLYGHSVGDDVLIRIANILKENIRTTDSVGRWGGEEFLIILPYTNLENACIVAEKLRAAISLEVFTVVKQVTCSFGVASFSEGDNEHKLLARADKALYKAKNAGRNKVKYE
jgi:diguanylate cyclase (GGDEF)-like protein